MNEAELRAFVKDISLDDNAKICILIGIDDTGEYRIIKCNADGELVIATP